MCMNQSMIKDLNYTTLSELTTMINSDGTTSTVICILIELGYCKNAEIILSLPNPSERLAPHA